MYTQNYTTNDHAKQVVYGTEYAEDFSAGGNIVRLPAISKHGCVRNHSTGEFREVVSAQMDKKARTNRGKQAQFAALAKREQARQAARAEMERNGWL